MPSMKLGVRSTVTGSPAASAALSGIAVSVSTATIRQPGRFAFTAWAMPAGEPAAADRDQHRLDLGQVLDDLRADRRRAGDHLALADRMEEDVPSLAGLARLHDPPPILVAVLVHLGAEPPQVLDLHPRRIVGDVDRSPAARAARAAAASAWPKLPALA